MISSDPFSAFVDTSYSLNSLKAGCKEDSIEDHYRAS